MSGLLQGKETRWRQEHNDEFDIDFPDTMRIEKYTHVVDWYRNPENRCYTKWNPDKKKWEKNVLQTMVAGIPHQFGWGGLHGAVENTMNGDIS